VGTEDFMDTLRVRPMDRKQLLDNLDHASKEGDARARRNNQRMEYRADKIQLSVTHPGGTLGRFYVKARNLSAGGLSFLHGGFLHIIMNMWTLWIFGPALEANWRLGAGLKAGQTVKGTLVFQKAGAVEVEFKVAPLGAQSRGGTGG